MHTSEHSTDNTGEGPYKKLIFSIDDKGNYISSQIRGWEPEDIALAQAWEQIDRRIKSVRDEVITGNLSPLAYYMEREMMIPKRLAGLTGIPAWRIKLHMKPFFFKRIRFRYLKRYSEFFKITVKELTDLSQ